MKQPWVQLKTHIFFAIFLQKLKLRRTNCYSSAAMSWKDVGNIRSDCSSPPAKWVGSVWTVCLMSVHCGFSVHQLSWLIIHHCLFVFNEYLFTPDTWSWKVTMASHIYLQFQLNIISTFMAFIVLFKSTCLSTVQEFTQNLQNTWKSWEKTQRVFKKRVPEK